MPVPEEVKIHRVIKVYPGDIAPGVNSVSIWTEEHATSGDVIEAVLDKLNIPASPERFDLIEVYDDGGKFAPDPELRGRARTIMEFESPVKVQIEWNLKESTSLVGGEYKFYLRQKSKNLVGELPGPRVTWLNGLHAQNQEKDDMESSDWNFEPTYRGPDEVDDLVDLPVLNEEILIENIEKRFHQGRIYTYVGGILLAINPFKYFPIYNPKYVLAYQHKKLMELPPHIFAIADVAYHRMLKDKKDQCIVISGESGSGKTENTKLILHHLTALSHKTQATVLERTILAAGPVLEAFGNAKTCHNNNSSRFGKFTQIDYRADGVVCGAILKKYLLEKSRIVTLAETERNYHVFYYILAGATQAERQRLHLTKPEDYFYLNQSNCYTIEAVEEDYEFFRLQQAMRNIGFTGEVQQRIFSVLSAVLHIGNVGFKKKDRDRQEDAVDVEDNGVVDIISKLLEVDKETLIESFTRRKTVTRGEQFIRHYKRAEAIATRDAMAKALYGSLFDWIVLQINHTLKTRHKGKTDVKAFSIGVLDIFGFEDFEVNSFEQLCINYANENLQFYLNSHIFKVRQNEYILEGLKWTLVDYEDNQGCLDLMTGKLGLFSLLDEECSLTVGTDESLLAKINKHHDSNKYYEKPPTKESAFSIVHYAGTVKYQIKDFKAKNQDLMRHDIVTSLRNSKMLFVRELMGSDPMAVFYWSIVRHTIRAISLFKKAGEARRNGKPFLENCLKVTWAQQPTSSPPDNRKLMIQVERYAQRRSQKPKRRPSQQRQNSNKSKPSRIRMGIKDKRDIASGIYDQNSSSPRGRSTRPPTVVAQFQSSLTELLETLNQSHPFFVRCIRSNIEKAPLKFDGDVVLRQLRYTGMLSCVKIRQAGYPCRISIQMRVADMPKHGKYLTLLGNDLGKHLSFDIAQNLHRL